MKSSILFTTSPLFNVKPQYRIIGYFGKYKMRKVLCIGGDELRRHLSLTQPICQLVENGIFEYFSMSERRRASDQDQDKIYPFILWVISNDLPTDGFKILLPF